jgi:hypothetical protein
LRLRAFALKQNSLTDADGILWEQRLGLAQLTSRATSSLASPKRLTKGIEEQNHGG